MINRILFFIALSSAAAARGDILEYARSHKVGIEFAPSLTVGFVQYDLAGADTPIGCEARSTGGQRCALPLVPDDISGYGLFFTRSGDRTGWFLVDWGLSLGLSRFKNQHFSYNDRSPEELRGMNLTVTTGPAHPIDDFDLSLTRIGTRAFIRLGFTPPLFPEFIWTGGYGLAGHWGRAGYDGETHFQRLYTSAIFNELELVWLRMFGGLVSSFMSYEFSRPTPLDLPETGGLSNFTLSTINISIGLARVVLPLPF